MANDKSRPRYLFAAVPDGSKSVVRYIWEIDWKAGLEFHPYDKGGATGKWGFKVKRGTSPEIKACKEKYLGKWLWENKGDRKVQALYGFPYGARVVGVRTPAS
jgi:hypothetical protein